MKIEVDDIETPVFTKVIIYPNGLITDICGERIGVVTSATGFHNDYVPVYLDIKKPLGNQ